MMKRKLSISIEENMIKNIEDFISDGTFRNKSHLIEFALNKYINEVRK